jgi:hypothetical protein
MALRKERVQVGARTFMITLQPTDVGKRLFFRLSKIAGPAFVELVKSVAASGKKLEDLDAADVLPSALELLERLEEKDFDLFFDAFIGSTEEISTDSKGKKQNVSLDASLARDEAFAGDYGGMLRWMFEHIRLNFGSFLAGWKPTARPASLPADPE